MAVSILETGMSLDMWLKGNASLGARRQLTDKFIVRSNRAR
jgi:hypothetical protein